MYRPLNGSRARISGLPHQAEAAFSTPSGTSPYATLHRRRGTDEEIAATLRVGFSIVHRTQKRFVEENWPGVLTEWRRLSASQKFDGKPEAFLVAFPVAQSQ